MSAPTRKLARGVYTLPLPPLPPRPRWRNGDGEKPGLWHRLAKVKHMSQEKRWEMPETLRERTRKVTLGYGPYPVSHTVTELVPIRSGGVQSWNPETGRWQACPNRQAVHRYLKGLRP